MEKRVAKLLGGFETTIYPTALGEMWRIANVRGPAIKLLGPQDEPCVHCLTADEARAVAAALLEIADEIEPPHSGARAQDASGTPTVLRPGSVIDVRAPGG